MMIGPELFALGLAAAAGAATQGPAPGGHAPCPLMRDFMGVNGHTVQFRPELYRPACRLARDYHGFGWDVGDDTSYSPRFPLSRNQVDWQEVYGDWKAKGFGIDVCIMFNDTPPKAWKDMTRDAAAYGEAFARFFGPSGERKLVEAAEVGNEPTNYDDAAYRRLFEAMASGFRRGDPQLLILPCNVHVGKSGQYDKNVEVLRGLDHLYDVLGTHVYAFAEQWPTWRRSFPEDPAIPYLKEVSSLLAWRDANARGKRVWITEFGWDASTKPPPATGDFAKWMDVSDEDQARYLVRSFLLFARMGVDRAYVYFFNDEDEPQLHGSSGLTRDYKPKPAFHAVAHLLATLGDYRFSRVLVDKPGEVCAFRFDHGSDPGLAAIAVWSPTGSGKTGSVEIPLEGARMLSATRMPLSADPAPAPQVATARDRATVACSEDPVYLLLKTR